MKSAHTASGSFVSPSAGRSCLGHLFLRVLNAADGQRSSPRSWRRQAKHAKHGAKERVFERAPSSDACAQLLCQPHAPKRSGRYAIELGAVLRTCARRSPQSGSFFWLPARKELPTRPPPPADHEKSKACCDEACVWAFDSPFILAFASLRLPPCPPLLIH